MNSILVTLRPFSLEQNVNVIKDNQQIYQEKVASNVLNSTVLTLSNKYDIDHITLSGPYNYAEGYKTEMEKFSISKYEKKINIEILSKRR